MGSAVSAVTGALGDVVGGAVGGIAGGITPKIQTADQARINDQIAALQAQTGQNVGTSQNLMGQAGGQLGNTQAVLNRAGNLVTEAQTANQLQGEDALNILRGAATGTAPSAAQAQLQAGTDQAIASQAALANSGNLSQMIGGQRQAIQGAGQAVQQQANQAAQLRAQEMATARGQYGTQANNFVSQEQQLAATQGGLANTNAGLYGTQLGGAQNFANLGATTASNAGNLAAGGVGLSQGVQTQNAQNQVQATGGLLNAGGTAMGLMSDEDLKTNIQSDRASRAKAVSGFFKNENKPSEPDTPAPDASSKPAAQGYAEDDPRKKAAQSISSGFMSDENAKKDIHEDSLLHAFLDKVNPVTYEYKDPTGEMGKTPGIHMGIIAQDVEKAPGGESMVHDTPEGKAIDLASAVGMLMSAAADAHDRISSVEELFKARKEKK